MGVRIEGCIKANGRNAPYGSPLLRNPSLEFLNLGCDTSLELTDRFKLLLKLSKL